MSIETYMRTVLNNLCNKKILDDIMYSENDKDCGYRSGLRYLNLLQTSETDDIAHKVIYGDSMPAAAYKPSAGVPCQLDLFA